jgi:hypothetical protein
MGSHVALSLAECGVQVAGVRECNSVHDEASPPGWSFPVGQPDLLAAAVEEQPGHSSERLRVVPRRVLPSWPTASSVTIRGGADPTWWRWSSALGGWR